MSKKLCINCGNAIILRDKPEVFDGYGEIWMNTGNLVITPAMNAALTSKNARINSGSTRIIEVSGELVQLPRGTRLNAAADYNGKFLFSEGNLIIEPGSAGALEGVTGIYASKIYRPESFDISQVPNVNAGKIAVYPDGAALVFGNLRLDEDAANDMEKNSVQYIDGEVTATDEKALDILRERGVALICPKLTIMSGLNEKSGENIRAEKRVIIPDGHAIITDDAINAGISLIHGDKIYVMGDFVITAADRPLLADFSSVIVRGTLDLSADCAADFKKIGKAGKINVYEGELMQINGEDTICHAQLAAAADAGIYFTIRVNGKLTFAEDVTAGDISCIKAFYYNGLVTVPAGIKPFITRVTKEGNGKMHSPGETGSDVDDMLNNLFTDKDATVINMGNYVL